MSNEHFLKPMILAVLGALALAAASPLGAATISWGPAQNISSDADVNTQGTLVKALSFGGVSATVNGVAFTDAFPYNPNKATSPDYPTGWSETNFNSSFDGFGNQANLPGDYLSLLQGGTLNQPQFGPYLLNASITMGGLSKGAEYLVQVWANDSRNFGNGAWNETLDASSTVLYDDPSNLYDGLGQFAVGTFVADAESQTIQFNANYYPMINAIQLRQLAAAPAVPAGPVAARLPASFGQLAFVGLGSLGLLLLRRRSVALRSGD